jgi:hypothetical protein
MTPDTAALDAVRDVLADALPSSEIRVEAKTRADFALRVGDHDFIVEAKSDARSVSVHRALRQLLQYSAEYPGSAPILVVPRMGDAGARLCERAGVNWVDLQRNADIRDLELRIVIRGRDIGELKSPRGSDSTTVNPFSLRASRIAHALLVDPRRTWTRAELASTTGLDKGFTSKIVRALLTGEYASELARGRLRELRVDQPLVLLDAWAEAYKVETPFGFGLIASKDGFDTVQQVADLCDRYKISYAFSGLPAAAAYTKFGSFRRVDIYVDKPLPLLIKALNVGSKERGRNVVITENAFRSSFGVELSRKQRFVIPALAYLDLAQVAERGEEARDELRRMLERKWK